MKYNTAYYGHKVHNVGSTNYAWCVVFQWWCFQKAGIPTSIFPKSANVFAVRDWYKKRGRYSSRPRVGSLAIFSFSHIGLVVKVNRDGDGAHHRGQHRRQRWSHRRHGDAQDPLAGHRGVLPPELRQGRRPAGAEGQAGRQTGGEGASRSPQWRLRNPPS